MTNGEYFCDLLLKLIEKTDRKDKILTFKDRRIIINQNNNHSLVFFFKLGIADILFDIEKTNIFNNTVLKEYERYISPKFNKDLSNFHLEFVSYITHTKKFVNNGITLDQKIEKLRIENQQRLINLLEEKILEFS